jgi:hypothetical protein
MYVCMYVYMYVCMYVCVWVTVLVVHGRDRCLLLVCEPCDRGALLENVSPCLTPSVGGDGCVPQAAW